MYLESMQNVEFATGTMGWDRRFKILMYYFFMILLTPYTNKTLKKIQVISGKGNLKFKNFIGFSDIFYGATEDSIFKQLYVPSHISFIHRCTRIKILLKSLSSYVYNMVAIKNYSAWVDFMFWDGFLKIVHPEIVMVNDHCDRNACFLSGLCEQYKISFYIKQHGLIYDSFIMPYKIFCNKLYAFNTIELLKYKNNMIKNSCFEYEQFYLCDVKFITISRQRYCIGIIESKFPEMKSIIDEVIGIIPNDVDICMMLHPTSHKDEYISYCNNENMKLTDKKIWNCDVIVAPPSTLVYDYIMNGYEGKIILCDFSGRLLSFKDAFSNIIYIDRIGELKSELLSLI